MDEKKIPYCVKVYLTEAEYQVFVKEAATLNRALEKYPPPFPFEYCAEHMMIAAIKDHARSQLVD